MINKTLFTIRYVERDDASKDALFTINALDAIQAIKKFQYRMSKKDKGWRYKYQVLNVNLLMEINNKV